MKVIMIECPKHGTTGHVVYKTRTRCKKCQTAATTKARKNLKIKAIEYKGGCCNICKESYTAYPEVLEFHHRDPSDKDFGIGNKGNIIGWAKVKVELDKCDMLCANCHRILHVDLKKLIG